jgi:enoyl-CoA hydratase/carnithine racemase
MSEDDCKAIRSHIEAGIAILTIDRPEKLNSLTPEGLSDLRQALVDADSHSDTRIIVLTGAGTRAFSAGFAILNVPDLSIADSRLLHLRNLELNRTLMALNKVTIAAVNGMALGAGFEISLLCDITLAAESATFGMPELAIGAYPGTIAPTLLWQFLGMKKANELILTGRTLMAREAETLGLVNQVVPDETLISRTLQLAREIMDMAPLPVAMYKARMNSKMRMLLEEEMSRFVEVQTLVFSSRDFKEGLTALKEKRKPAFSGE